MSKEENFKEARKGMMLKSLADKKDREGRVTFSISIERQVKELLDNTSDKYGLSSSYLLNELIKRALN